MKKYYTLIFIPILFSLLVFQDCFAFLRNRYNAEDRTTRQEEDQVLYVISMDAFRPEYLERRVTPFMQFLRDSGSFSPYVNPVFPTKTLVNHFSIATGLYPGTHGVLDNRLYDPDLGVIKYSYELFHQNKSVTPIWTLNELQGKHSGCMMWPGSHFPYQNKSCTFGQNYDQNLPWEDRITKTLDWILDPVTPANLIMHYVDQPDGEAHPHSPDSAEVLKMLRKLDSFVSILFTQMYYRKIHHRINVIILSDHGMATVRSTNYIDWAKYLRPNTYQMVASSPTMQIIPAPGSEDEVWRKLVDASNLSNNNFKVYNNLTAPERWNVKQNRRFGPILVVADPPYVLKRKKHNATIYGVHGYDNNSKDMRAIFFAYGPMFAKGKELKPFNNVDLFQFFCIFLKLKCIPTEGEDRSDIWNQLLRQNDDPCAIQK